MNGSTELVRRYFELALSPDREAYFAQFAVDASAQDEGHEYQGIAAIRAWRGEVPAVTYGALVIEPDGTSWRAQSVISGDFPGSPVTLSFRFTYDSDDRITRLAITA